MILRIYVPTPLLIMFLLLSMVTRCEKDGIPGNDENSEDTVIQSEYMIRPVNSGSTLVSDKLMGFNVIYPHEKNAIWQDNKIAGYLKDVNVGFIRYPGGTVCSFYHWDALTGEGWKDSWDPQNPVPPKNGSEFMDIDEYIALVRKTGATPLVGINMSSGWRWNRQSEGIKEAIDLMKYCRDKNFDVEFWYLDNEPYQHDSNGGSKTPEQYAALVNAYAPAMKAFDPDIKIVVNWNAGFKNKRSEYNLLISQAGAHIDVIDAHWYWAWSDASWSKWLEKTPMLQWTGLSYPDDITYFRQMVKELGHPNIKLASFEWNTGPTKASTFTSAQMALTQAEMMMQFISGGLDYAVFWPIHWPDESSKTRSFVNTSTNAANPVYHLFQFLGNMQGGLLLTTEILKTGIDILSVAVMETDQKTIRICILNKNAKDQVTDIQMDKFPGAKCKEAKTYTVNGDGSQYLLTSITDMKSEKAGLSRFNCKGVSFTMVTYENN